MATRNAANTAKKPEPVSSGNGRELKLLLRAGTVSLEKHAASINALNVFPVPDGDTGTNMLLTMQAALQEIDTTADDSAASVARAAAHGALMGARGNSGVILSQLLRGLATGLDNKTQFDGADFAAALTDASVTAYKGVMKPVEGTILTVGREAAEGARAAVDEGHRDLFHVMERVVSAARDSVARTPSLLNALREAGVVDAGGQGLLVILDGALRYMRGESVDMVEASAAVNLPAAHTPAQKETQWGYCTEFVLRGKTIDLEEFKQRISAWGDSVLVVGDQETIKVHVHTFRPGEVISYASSMGTLHGIKMDNMQDQHQDYLVMAQKAKSAPTVAEASGIAIVAVVSGPGLVQVVNSLGVSATVPGGQTMNPSTQQLLQAIESQSTRDVIVLPNNGNVILAAEKAVELSKKNVAIVPSETIPQGISALLAFNYQADLEKNVAAMRKAIRTIETAEITRAIRSANIGGLEVQEGEIIGLLNGDLIASGETVDEVAFALLEQAEASQLEIITMYYGEGIALSQAEKLAKKFQERYPEQEVELIDGGQPHYYYIISAE